jgi:hypothetical protein
MTPEIKAQYKADLARVRFERDQYAARAARNRKEAIELRKKRRWLDALLADSRASEYRNTRDQYAAEARRIQDFLK